MGLFNFAKVGKLSTLATGIVIGSVGLEALTSKLAQRGYKYVIAGGMIVKDRLMEDAEKVQAVLADSTEDAKVITEKYYKSLDKEYEAKAAAPAPAPAAAPKAKKPARRTKKAEAEKEAK